MQMLMPCHSDLHVISVTIMINCLQHDVECENGQTIDIRSASSVQKDTTAFEMGESLRSGQLNSDSQDMKNAQLTDDILGPIIKCKEAGEKPAEKV